MPRRTLITALERTSLLSVPADRDTLIRHYTFSPEELVWINSRREDFNRLGFAVQLSYMKYPGIVLDAGATPDENLLGYVSEQLAVPPARMSDYGRRGATHSEHLLKLHALLGVRPFDEARDRRPSLVALSELALRTDKGLTLAASFIADARRRKLLLPKVEIIESICAEAVTQGERRIHELLAGGLTAEQRKQLDGLLAISPERGVTGFTWLRQSVPIPTAAQIVRHIERLNYINQLKIPSGVGRSIHQNRLRKIAATGMRMTAQHLRELEPGRRYATLVAVVLETRATLIDEVVELNDRMIGGVFNTAKRRYEAEFLAAQKGINRNLGIFARIGRALLLAKRNRTNPLAAIPKIIGWAELEQHVEEAETLARSEKLEFLLGIVAGYRKVHGYSAEFLNAVELRSTVAGRDVFDAVQAVKRLHHESHFDSKSVPLNFVKAKWRPLVFNAGGIDRRYYELCAMSELRNSLRSGDIWVEGSRQFKDVEEYLLPRAQFDSLKATSGLPVSVEVDGEKYLSERMRKLTEQLNRVNQLARDDHLPDVALNDGGLKVTPLDNSVPDLAQPFVRSVYRLLPRVKITDVLLDVDEWTGFSKHFTHERTERPASDRQLLLTGILSDGLNLGLAKMAEACPGMTYDRLSLIYGWHIREQGYSAGLAEIINQQRKFPIAQLWGDGSTSASDGQRFRSGGHASASGTINPKYGSDPGVTFYSHVSDQYGPFHTKVINVGLREATHAFDGLLYHETELHIKEHYTDTAGFTDHVFALMHLLGFKFAPRIRGLADKKLYRPPGISGLTTLEPMLGDELDPALIKMQWDEVLRLASSIRQGTVTASLMLRKLGSYPRQNGLALALREIGRIERTLFMLEWFQDPDLRRRVQGGLNKNEGRNALARAVAVHRAGEIRDRTFENQKHRANGLNLVVAAIVLWNTVNLDRAIASLRKRGTPIDPSLLPHLSPLGWSHINLTGDYVWRPGPASSVDGYRPLRN